MNPLSYERIIGEDGSVGLELMYDLAKNILPCTNPPISILQTIFFQIEVTPLAYLWRSLNRFNVIENDKEISKGYAGLGIAIMESLLTKTNGLG